MFPVETKEAASGSIVRPDKPRLIYNEPGMNREAFMALVTGGLVLAPAMIGSAEAGDSDPATVNGKTIRGVTQGDLDEWRKWYDSQSWEDALAADPLYGKYREDERAEKLITGDKEIFGGPNQLKFHGSGKMNGTDIGNGSTCHVFTEADGDPRAGCYSAEINPNVIRVLKHRNPYGISFSKKYSTVAEAVEAMHRKARKHRMRTASVGGGE